MTAMRNNIWRDLMEKRDALIRSLEAANASPVCDFTDEDSRQWQEIADAVNNTPKFRP